MYRFAWGWGTRGTYRVCGFCTGLGRAAHIQKGRALHISGMYTKTSVEVSFEVHTSGRKAAKARSVRGMYKRTALQGRFCVHTRYVQPTAPSVWEGNGITGGDVHTRYVPPGEDARRGVPEKCRRTYHLCAPHAREDCPEWTVKRRPPGEGRSESPSQEKGAWKGAPCTRREGIPATGCGFFQKNRIFV